MMRDEKENVMKTILKNLTMALVALCLLATSGVVSAVTMVPVNLAKIVEYTEKAFVGEVRSVETIQTAQGWADKVTMVVTENVLGDAEPGQLVIWNQFRGSKEAPMQDMPTYTPGEERLVFLAAKAAGSELQAPYGLGQGIFKVQRQPVSGRTTVLNSFGNSNLFQNLDTKEVATKIVETDQAQSRLAAPQKTMAVDRLSAQLSSVSASSLDLTTIKNAAQVMAKEKKPSVKFAEKNPAKAGSETGVLKAVINTP